MILKKAFQTKVIPFFESTLKKVDLGQDSFLDFTDVSQVVVFKPLSYCLEEAVGFDLKTSFARPPV